MDPYQTPTLITSIQVANRLPGRVRQKADLVWKGKTWLLTPAVQL